MLICELYRRAWFDQQQKEFKENIACVCYLWYFNRPNETSSRVNSLFFMHNKNIRTRTKKCPGHCHSRLTTDDDEQRGKKAARQPSATEEEAIFCHTSKESWSEIKETSENMIINRLENVFNLVKYIFFILQISRPRYIFLATPTETAKSRFFCTLASVPFFPFSASFALTYDWHLENIPWKSLAISYFSGKVSRLSRHISKVSELLLRKLQAQMTFCVFFSVDLARVVNLRKAKFQLNLCDHFWPARMRREDLRQLFLSPMSDFDEVRVGSRSHGIDTYL